MTKVEDGHNGPVGSDPSEVPESPSQRHSKLNSPHATSRSQPASDPSVERRSRPANRHDSSSANPPPTTNATCDPQAAVGKSAEGSNASTGLRGWRLWSGLLLLLIVAG